MVDISMKLPAAFSLFYLVSQAPFFALADTEESSVDTSIDRMIVHRFYSSEYLATLSETEREEASEPEVYTIDMNSSGKQVLQRDTGNGLLVQGWVPNDPRRADFFSRPIDAPIDFGVSGIIDTFDDSFLDEDEVQAWFRDSIGIWFEQARCVKDTPFEEVPVDDTLPGLVQNFFFTGTFDFSLLQTSLNQVGFLSGSEMPFFAANPNVLGVAFSFIWGEDLDGDGRDDTAAVEIYYNGDFLWTTDETLAEFPRFDFPSVAIHEAGHAVGNAHFGKIELKRGQIIGKPRAIMNAVYSGPLRRFRGIDTRAICNGWSSWPGL